MTSPDVGRRVSGPEQNDITDLALDNLDLGFLLFPVWGTRDDGTCRCPKGADCDRKPGKHPITPHGFKDSTDDPDKVTTFLKSGHNYGMVWPEGADDIVFLWDVDGDDWRDQLTELSERYGKLPTTKVTKTPSGGLHLFYRWPKGVEVPSGDIFGFVTRWPFKGYVVGPGSSIGTKTYDHAGDHDIAEFPAAWAASAVAAKKDAHNNGANIEDIHPGQRHDALRDAARYMRGRGLTGEALFAAVDGINQNLPDPKPDADVRRAIGDADAKFTTDPAQLSRTEPPADDEWPVIEAIGGKEPLPRFPVEVLPDEAGELVRAVAGATETDPSMGAIHALGIMGATLGHRVHIEGPNAVWTEFGLHLWTVVPSPSGSGKTEVMGYLAAPLKDLNKQARQADSDEAGRKDTLVTAQQVKLTRLKRLAGKTTDEGAEGTTDLDGDPVQKVSEQAVVEATRELEDLKRASPLEEFILDDSTPEALTQMMDRNFIGRAVMLSDESDVLSTMGGARYNPNPLIGPLLTAFSSKSPINVKRTTRHDIAIENPCLAIITTCQPRTVYEARQNGLLDERGFSARCLWCWPVENTGKRKLAGRQRVTDVVMQAWAGLVMSLDAVVTNSVPSSPDVLTLDSEAAAAFVDWHDNLLEPQRDPVTGELSTTNGLLTWASRAHGMALRIAGLLHIARRAGKGSWSGVVERVDVENAIKVIDFGIDHARNTFGVPRTDPVGIDALRLRSWYRAHGHEQFSVRDARRTVEDWPKERVMAALLRLDDHGYVRVLDPKSGEKGGRPTQHVVVNPADRVNRPYGSEEEAEA